MARYDYACSECGARFEHERPVAEAGLPASCPVCESPARRVYTPPRLLFKADRRDVRPVWHQHDGYAHAHPPRCGRHRTSAEDH